MLFHEEEKSTTAILETYEDKHPSTLVILEFKEGDSYKCRFDTAYESENGLELDDPKYDEYYELVYKVEEVITSGPNCENPEHIIFINYKHFPTKVIAENGDIVYKA